MFTADVVHSRYGTYEKCSFFSTASRPTIRPHGAKPLEFGSQGPQARQTLASSFGPHSAVTTLIKPRSPSDAQQLQPTKPGSATLHGNHSPHQGPRLTHTSPQDEDDSRIWSSQQQRGNVKRKLISSLRRFSGLSHENPGIHQWEVNLLSACEPFCHWCSTTTSWLWPIWIL